MWRTIATHKEETKVVKKALLDAGLDVRSVGHGHGTGWAWLDIRLARALEHGCEEHGTYGDYQNRLLCVGCRVFHDKCRELDRKAVEVAQKVTGRHGEYDGQINVHWES